MNYIGTKQIHQELLPALDLPFRGKGLGLALFIKSTCSNKKFSRYTDGLKQSCKMIWSRAVPIKMKMGFHEK